MTSNKATNSFEVDLQAALAQSETGPKAIERPRLIMGIDPGLNGGIAVFDPFMNKVRGIHEMPTSVPALKKHLKGVEKKQAATAAKRRRKVDGTALAHLIDGWSSEIGFCVIEDVHSMPSDGTVGAFSFGFSTGIIHGVLSTCNIPTFRVGPAVWKAHFNLHGTKKDASRYLAQKLFPEWSLHFGLGKDDGKAEALLIALFASRFVKKNASS